MIDHNRIVLVTCCRHRELLEKWKEFIPYDIEIDIYYIEPRVGEKSYGKNNDYFPNLLRYSYDWVIHVDEDAFIYSFRHIERLLEYMKNHDIGISGMPDGGCIPIRWQNKVCMSSCFLIFNMEYIRRRYDELYTLPWVEVLKSPKFCFNLGWSKELEKHIPIHLMHFDNGGIYPYLEGWYPFMYFMIDNFRHLYLDS